jgi:hypothetical protein
LTSSKARTHRAQAEIPKSHNPTPDEKYQSEGGGGDVIRLPKKEIVEDGGRVERKRYRGGRAGGVEESEWSKFEWNRRTGERSEYKEQK